MNTKQLLEMLKKPLKMMKGQQHHYLLALLLAVFIVFDVDIPDGAKMAIDSLPGKIVLAVVAILLVYIHPLVGAVGIVALYLLMKRSERLSGPVHRHVPSENRKQQKMQHFNKMEKNSLEEEIVAKMIPRVAKTITIPTYKPTLCKLHEAARL
tara:strand:+ start:340 stop:798 length:459 start_codon:yes stop_codon:yes gene_type:complete